MVLEAQRARQGGGSQVVARLSTETKHALKTTEFWAFIAVVAGILIASAMIGEGEGTNGGGDAFPAQRAWLYIAIVTAGYMASRGLAKAGSREPYWADRGDLPGSRNDS